MKSTGSPVPDSRTRTRTAGDTTSTQRSCTSSPFAAARRCSTSRSLASTPTAAQPKPVVAYRGGRSGRERRMAVESAVPRRGPVPSHRP